MTDTEKASGGRTRRATTTATPRASVRGGTGRTVKATAHVTTSTATLPTPPSGFHEPTMYIVRPGEDPWDDAELSEVREGLIETAHELRAEIAVSENGIADLLRDSGEGAGDDQADTGTKNFEREHEMSLTNNARGMLLQSEKALRRLADGTYGACESCGSAIGKARLQAFPRATLCVTCKQREERR
jgi:DnaK suppressor protein